VDARFVRHDVEDLGEGVPGTWTSSGASWSLHYRRRPSRASSPRPEVDALLSPAAARMLRDRLSAVLDDECTAQRRPPPGLRSGAASRPVYNPWALTSVISTEILVLAEAVLVRDGV
jgi:hypothetical protein